jgi:hypothetical protein
MMAAAFFEPGKTYIRSEPYTAPELLPMFYCVAVAEHPAKAELRAFGFLAAVYPGDNWGSDARTPEDWAAGWSEYEPTNDHSCDNCSGIDPETCPFNDAKEN